MICLITGAGGFAGGFLARHLIAQGHEVHGLALPGQRTPGLEGSKGSVTLHEGDVLDAEALKETIARVSPHRVYHLAARSAVGDSWRAVKPTFETNLIGGVNLMEACRPVREKARVLIVSTAGVYRAGPEPITDDSPIAPASPYAVSKLALDLLAAQYAETQGFHVVRARPSNHTGPGQDARFAVPAFARRIAEIERGAAEPLLRVGNLNARRDFTDARDVVRAYALALERGASGQSYLIASGVSRTMRAILDAMLAASPRRIEVVVDEKKLRAADPDYHFAPPARLRDATGWKPEIPFERTLADTLAFWRERGAAGGV